MRNTCNKKGTGRKDVKKKKNQCQIYNFATVGWRGKKKNQRMNVCVFSIFFIAWGGFGLRFVKNQGILIFSKDFNKQRSVSTNPNNWKTRRAWIQLSVQSTWEVVCKTKKKGKRSCEWFDTNHQSDRSLVLSRWEFSSLFFFSFLLFLLNWFSQRWRIWNKLDRIVLESAEGRVRLW